MIPQEVKFDFRGWNRIQRIGVADRLLHEARIMAAAYVADPERGFADFGDEACEQCSSARCCGMKKYEECLTQTAAIYRDAGLGTLADRVDAIRYLPPSEAWEQFDQANAAEGLS